MYRVQGKYITFVDADDYIDCDLLSSIYRAVTKYKFPEAVKYGFCEEYYNSKNTLVLQKRVVFPAEFVMTAQDVRKSILQEMPYFFGYTCNTFYKTISLQLSSLKFEKINMIEDYIFNVAYFENITTFAVVDIGAYHYCKRPNNSLSSKVVEDYFIVSSKRINIWLEKAQSWGLLDKNLLDNIFWTYTRYVYSAICRMLVCSQKESSRQELENIYHTELFNQFSHIEFSNCTLKQKIMTMFLQRRCSRTVIFMCSCFNLMRTHLPKFFAMFKD